MLHLTDAALDRLDRLQPELAGRGAISREIEDMRRTGVYDLKRTAIHRERIRAAQNRWGHQLRGDNAGPA